MRIVLIYPPPWKIPGPAEMTDKAGEGPPRHWKIDDRFSGDEMTVPYGLLSLAAQAKRAGHEVTVLNLYTFTWPDIRQILMQIKVDLFGLSCFTSNRRGALSLASFIREHYPQAFIVFGGPHAGAMPRRLLEHCPAIDGIVVGEGETTFMELLDRLERKQSLSGLAGLVYRTPEGIESGPPRSRIDDLDSLASPYDYCSGHIFLSSRGCPGKCTFCGSPFLWGPKVRFHSAPYSLSILEKLVRGHQKKYICIKDDTFTADRKRVLEICKGIASRDLHFLWSCDTRVDFLDEEMLFAMRKAGCQLISLGVESGSPDILKNLNKHTTPKQILEATALLKKFGFTIRYYMIAGSRAETAATLNASFDLILQAKPNQFVFCFLTLFPGTEEFTKATASGRMDWEIFFNKDFQYFTYQTPEQQTPEMKPLLEWINLHNGVQNFWEYGVREREAHLDFFSDCSFAHMDLARACYLAGDWTRAEEETRQSLQMGFPLPGLGYNYLACIAAKRGNIAEALSLLTRGQKTGRHFCIQENLMRLGSRPADPQSEKPDGPALIAYHEFEPIQTDTQPMVPGPITLKIEPGVNSESIRFIPSQ